VRAVGRKPRHDGMRLGFASERICPLVSTGSPAVGQKRPPVCSLFVLIHRPPGIVKRTRRPLTSLRRGRKAKLEAVAYLRTSSAANVGADKDSDRRQRAAIAGFAKRSGIEVVGEFYDQAVSGADPIESRPGLCRSAR
jgi:resolvase-like protein